MSLSVYLVYLALLILIPLLAQGKVKRAYNKYSQIRNTAGMTGAEVARKILQDNGIYDVQVEETKGTLSDHYDPKAKAVRLSSDNYHKHPLLVLRLLHMRLVMRYKMQKNIRS